MATIISVDWDYFLPDLSGFDWGMNEEKGFFYEMIWLTRYRNRCMLTGQKAYEIMLDYEGFWKDLLGGKTVRRIAITDSHKELSYFLNSESDVYNFDQHHDFGYGQLEKLDCGNWARLSMLNTYALIYPKWRMERPETMKPNGIDIFYNHQAVMLPDKIDLVFVCRSSCWTPSWLDNCWLDFIEELEDFAPHAWKNKIFAADLLKPRYFSQEVADRFA